MDEADAGQKSPATPEAAPPRRLRKFLFSLLRIFILLVLVLSVMASCFGDRFIFVPSSYPEGYWGMLKTDSSLEEVTFTAADGTKLNGWFSPATGSRQVLLWCHGNAGNITHRYDMLDRLRAVGCNIFIFDYRGYGKSEGTPSEAGVYSDARGAYDFLRGRGFQPKEIILFGKSLGSAVAIESAKQVECGGLIVQSGLTSVRDMTATVVPLLPLHLLMKSKLASIDKVGSVSVPKLFIHSPADEVIPYDQGRRLYEAAIQPKRFYEIPKAPHNETYIVGGKAYIQTIKEFIEKDCAIR